MASDRSGEILRHLRRLTANQADAALSDRELLQRFAARRDEAAFGTLVRRHGRMVLGVCRRVSHQEQDAEDAFQATFLILARKAASSGWKESIGNWLYRVAYHLAVRARRQACRRQARERRPASQLPPDPLSEVTLRESQRVLDDELDRLPEKFRAPLVLCCLEGNTRDEAAQQLGWSVATLKRRLGRGRELLALRLRRRGLTLPALFAGLTLAESAVPAAIPSALLTSTVSSALLPNAATAGPGAVSVQTALLVRGMLRTMVLFKVKAVLAAVVLVGLGAALAWQSASPAPHGDTNTPGTPAKEPSQARTDRFGDPLPPGASMRLGSLRLRHKTGIRSTAFAAGGRVLIAAGDDGLVRFWDPATGKELRHIEGYGEIACSPEGKTLATLGGEAVVLWDVATGKELRKLRRRAGNPAGALVPLMFAPDGRTIAALAGEQSVSVWDVATGREQAHLPAHEKPIVCLGFASDGKSILTAVGARLEEIVLRQWDSATGKELRTVRVPAPRRKAWLRPLAFSPDGKTIALEEAAEARVKEGNVTHVFTEYRLSLTDVVTGQEQRRLDATAEVIWSAAFAPDSKSVACQRMDGSVSAWDATTGQSRFTHPGYPGSARPDGAVTLAFTPDGKRLATVGESGVVLLWDVAAGREVGANAETHHGSIACVAFAPDGKTAATGSGDHTIRLWDTTTGKQQLCLTGHTRPVRWLVYSRDGRMLASAGEDDTIRLWDLAAGKERLHFKEQRKPRSVYYNYGVHALVFPPDGQTLISWGEDQTLHVWDLTTGKERSARQVQLPGLSEPPQPEPGNAHPAFPKDHISWAAFTPDGRTVLLASNKTVYLVDVASGREVFTIPNPSWRSCLDLSPDGQTLVIGRIDKTVRLFELATGKEVLRMTLPERADRVAFSPDGRRLALAATFPQSILRIRHVATGEEQATLGGPDAYVRALAFRPGGRMLASGLSDTTTVLWDVSTTPQRPERKELTADMLEQSWNDLAGPDAAKAHAAIWTLAANAEQAVTLLNRRLRAAPRIDPKRIAALLAQLDHNEFGRREEASRELKKLGVAAETALRAVLESPHSAEAGRRVKDILATPPPWMPQDPEALRRRRAVQVLERIGSPAAGVLLEQLARGAASAPETRLADDARKRMDRRAP